MGTFEWIQVEDRKPAGEKAVIVCIRGDWKDPNSTRRRILRATYAAPFSLPYDGDIPGFAEETEDGEEYCPEGWYECNESDEIYVRIEHGTVTHWTMLPLPA